MNIPNKWIDLIKTEKHIFPDKPKRFSRVWRRIFGYIPNIKGEVLDVGCGIGKHLAEFLSGGWDISGIDCSQEILDCAKEYLGEKANLMLGDFMEYEFNKKYDLVFHIGVVEHYLEKEERLSFLKKMLELVKDGGYMISIVPINIKERKTPTILEIDYTSKLMKEEFEEIKAEIVKIFPHNLKGIFAPIPFSIEKFSTTLIGIIKGCSR